MPRLALRQVELDAEAQTSVIDTCAPLAFEEVLRELVHGERLSTGSLQKLPRPRKAGLERTLAERLDELRDERLDARRR